MVRVISLSDDAYLLLKRQKRPGESFSMVVRRISGGKKESLLKHAGWWHGSKEELDRIFGEILERRHKVDRRLL